MDTIPKTLTARLDFDEALAAALREWTDKTVSITIARVGGELEADVTATLIGSHPLGNDDACHVLELDRAAVVLDRAAFDRAELWRYADGRPLLEIVAGDREISLS